MSATNALEPIEPMKREAATATFSAWMESHGDIPRRAACVHASGAADRADLEQQMLIQIWRSISRFRGECAVSTWIYRVCLNSALTWRRGETRRRRWHDPRGLEDTAAAAAPDHEQIERLYAAIRLLPAIDRSLVMLSLDEVGYREIAQITGLSESNVGARLTRARHKLAVKLRDE